MAMSPKKMMAMGDQLKNAAKKMMDGGKVKKMRGGGMAKKMRGGGMAMKKMKKGGKA